jgi:CBS domain-containing protein
MVSDEHWDMVIAAHDYLIGIISERDIVRAIADGRDADTAKVSEYMTPDPDFLEPDVEVTDAAEWMLAAGYRHLPVAEEGRVLGIVSMKDVMWAITGEAGVRNRRSGHGRSN